MIHLISKFLVLPFYPTGLVLILLVLAIVALVKHNRKLGLIFVSCGAGLLYFFSMPYVAHVMMRSLESRYNPLFTYPKSSAIVLLGGCGEPRIAPRIYDETNFFGDRLMQAARLMKQNCAPKLIITGGKIEFVKDFPGSEAEANARLLVEKSLFAIDSSSLLIETRARNTHDNAVFVKKMLDRLGMKPDIILVTSAVHMYRSVRLFKKAGFIVHPAPTDFWEDASFQFNLYNFRPDTDALNRCTVVLHEWYGLIAYTILRWI